MTDGEITIATSLMSGAGIGLAAVTRWAVALWATIRREDIAATKESATLKREQDARLVERQIATIDRVAIMVDEHTARDLAAQAEVKQAIVRLEAKFDARDWYERTPAPPEDNSQRRRTSPQGYRPPRPGGHDD